MTVYVPDPKNNQRGTAMPTSLDNLYTQSPGTVQATAPPPAATRDAVASTSGSQAAQAASAAHTGYNAQQGTVADSELASTELNRITAQDSPLMQRAKAAAAEYSNSRGLLNSSIAAGATMGAMVDRATPLAQQDAAAKRNQALYNLDAENRSREFGASASNTAALRNAELETDTSQANAAQASESARLNASLGTNTALANSDATNRSLMQQAELATNVSLANVDAENRMRESVMAQNAELNRQYLAGTQAMDLAGIQGRYQQLIASNESASNLYESFFNSISAAMANDQLPPDRIAQYVRVQQSMLESGLQLIDSLNALDLDIDVPGVGVTGTGATSAVVPTPSTPATPATPAGAAVPPPPTPPPPITTGGVGTVIANARAQAEYRQQLAAWNAQYGNVPRAA